jgi:hypothetical protein
MTQADWTDGYITSVDYTMGYYPELNPLRNHFALLMEGYGPPPPGPCCELGFGQGLSVAMHAAAGTDRTWWGTDFNPSHAFHARQMADAAGVTAHLGEESFAEFCGRDDLPQFAFIGLHGIWSWVSEENRALIVDFLRRKLMTGGVVYVSYNTQPGWAAMLPVRHLMTEHARWMSAPGHTDVQQMKDALDFVGKLFDLEPVVAKVNPQLKPRIADLQTKAPEYLVHEYLNREWHPMPFSQLADQLQSAKLSYATSAVLQERITEIQLTPEQAAFIEQIPHGGFRESVRDMIVNQQFRRDIWVRGARKLTRAEQMRQIENMHLVLGTDAASIPTSIKGPRGEANLNKESTALLVGLLSEGNAPARLGDLLPRMAAGGVRLEGTLSLLSMLLGMGLVHPAVSSDEAQSSRASSDRLNRYIIERSSTRSDIGYLASPATGGAIPVPASMHAFIAAYQAGATTAVDCAQRVHAAMQAASRFVLKDGEAVKDRDAALAMLMPVAERVREGVMPVLRRALIVD